MRRFRYLTFDCYGTLIDWKTGIESALGRAFEGATVRGRDLTSAYLAVEKEEEGSYKKYREVLEKTATRLAAEFGARLEPRKAREFAASVPDWPAFPDTAAALKELGRKGYKRHILSNVDTDLLQGTIRNAGLEVDGFVTAEETRSYKPSPGHWLTFMKKTGAGKDEILHVAYSVFHDIVPTGRMGVASAWVNRYNERLLPGAQPQYISDSLTHLVDLLG